jgi:hypothetical protein
MVLTHHFAFTFSLQIATKYGADERTRTADLISLRVITQALQGCAGDCKCRISKRLSLLRVAACCTVLRSRWYQIGIRTSDSYSLTVGPMARPRDLRSHNPPTPFLVVAAGCRIRLSKLIFLLVVARRFCVLRAQWCQKWCQTVPERSEVWVDGLFNPTSVYQICASALRKVSIPSLQKVLAKTAEHPYGSLGNALNMISVRRNQQS